MPQKFAILWVDEQGHTGRLPKLYNEIDASRKASELNQKDKKGRTYRTFAIEQSAGRSMLVFLWIPILLAAAAAALKYLGLLDKYLGMINLP